MATSTIGSVGASTAARLSMEDLLHVLLTELTHQDPLKPVENKDFMAQIAQLSSLDASQRLNQNLEQLLTLQSLNQSVGADDEGELGDLFADREAADPFDEAEESLRRQGVRRALDALPERERRILELRFGFEGEPWTLEAIGNELDLTRERVRQLEGQALSRLAALRELASLAA